MTDVFIYAEGLNMARPLLTPGAEAEADRRRARLSPAARAWTTAAGGTRPAWTTRAAHPPHTPDPGQRSTQMSTTPAPASLSATIAASAHGGAAS